MECTQFFSFEKIPDYMPLQGGRKMRNINVFEEQVYVESKKEYITVTKILNSLEFEIINIAKSENLNEDELLKKVASVS